MIPVWVNTESLEGGLEILASILKGLADENSNSRGDLNLREGLKNVIGLKNFIFHYV